MENVNDLTVLSSVIEILSSITNTVVGLVMAWLAYKTYLKAPEQTTEPEPDSASDETAQEELHEILVFKTSRQETWLKSSPSGVSCRIVDTRPSKGGPQWNLSPDIVKSIVETRAYHVNPGYKVRTGTFTLGPKRNWLYTKSLFPEPDYLESVLKKLMDNVIRST